LHQHQRVDQAVALASSARSVLAPETFSPWTWRSRRPSAQRSSTRRCWQVVGGVQQIEDYAELADTIASHVALKIPDRQAILETTAVTERLEKVFGLMEREISVLQVEKRIRTRVKRQMEKSQREYFLNEQMKAIQKEIGDEEGRDEFAEIEDKIKKTKLSKEAREKANHELKKLRQISSMSAEATVGRNYLDWLLSIPWAKPCRNAPTRI
jgi:ATP-dependent Lon protease